MDSVEYLSFGRWTSKRFLVLMGCSATKEDVTALAQNRIPLAGVLTTACDDRQLEDYMDWLAESFNVSVSIEEYMSNTRTSQRLTMVRLLETADTSDVDKYFGDSVAARTPEFKANRLQRALLSNAPLWIIGFDRANQFDSDASIPLLTHLKNRGSETIFFWGMAPSAANSPLRKYAEETNQGYFEETISAAFAQVEQDISEDTSAEYSAAAEVSNDFYYSGGAVVSVDSVQIKRYSATATLLTWNLLSDGIPEGKFEQQSKFEKFLTDSCNVGPQWYGYSRKSPFYVEREGVDAPVMELVNDQFQARKKGVPAIAISGPAGSGKSVALANLSYKMFMAREHPVIFIPGTTSFFSDTSEHFQQLNDLLRLIENKSVKRTGILLVWDCSSFREGAKFARELCENLWNQGRQNFILVYSSYGESSACNEGVPPKIQGREISLTRHFMGNGEKKKFIEKAERYSGLDKETLEELKRKTEKIDDIFTWFYRVLLYMQETLKKSFIREKDTVSDYIFKTQQNILKAQESEHHGTMYEQLRALLPEMQEIFPDTDRMAVTESGEQDLFAYYDSFSCLAALFALTGSPLSENLANLIMCDDLDKKEDELGELTFDYDRHRQLICNTLIYDIPWIIYHEAPSADESFYQFRSSAEAEIFLRQYPVEKILDKVCRLLSLCLVAYRKFNFIPGRDLANLLRMIGPNTPVDLFKKGALLDMQKFYDRIISRLEEWSQDGLDNPAWDFTILRLVYAREYYSNVLKCSAEEKDNRDLFEERLENLIQCIYDAQSSADQLEGSISDNPRLRLSLDNIYVELLSCQRQCEKILDEYDNACFYWGERKEQSRALHEKFSRYRVRYAQAFLWMQSAISRDPENGYYYIALFHAFVREFFPKTANGEKAIHLEEKMRRCQEIQLYVDQAVSGGITIINRGSNGQDELGDRCMEVQRLIDGIFSNYDMSIDAVRENRMSEASRKVYEQLLKSNSSAGIRFIVRQELTRGKINLFRGQQLSPEQIKICRKAMEFIQWQEGQFPLCLDEYYIRYTLLQLQWAVANGVPFNTESERQATHLSEEQWKQLYITCCDTREAAKRDKITLPPLFVVIYALSELQVNSSIDSQTKEMFAELNSMRGRRMYSPYRVTDSEGKDCVYRGTVQKAPKSTSPVGKMRIRTKYGIVTANFNRRYIEYDGRILEGNTMIPNLGISISYTGLQTYSLSKLEDGRHGLL